MGSCSSQPGPKGTNVRLKWNSLLPPCLQYIKWFLKMWKQIWRPCQAVKSWSFNVVENCTYQHISLMHTLFLTSLSFHIPVLYVSRSCYNKEPQPEWFTQKKYIVSQVCRLEVWDHNVGRCGCSFWALWEDNLVHCLLPSLWCKHVKLMAIELHTSSREFDVLTWFAGSVWHRLACTSMFISPIWTLPTSLRDVHSLSL